MLTISALGMFLSQHQLSTLISIEKISVFNACSRSSMELKEHSYHFKKHLFIWPCHAACGISVSRDQIRSTAVKIPNPKHWTDRELSHNHLLLKFQLTGDMKAFLDCFQMFVFLQKKEIVSTHHVPISHSKSLRACRLH